MKHLRQYIRELILCEDRTPYDELIFRDIRNAKLFDEEMPDIDINFLADIVNLKNDYITSRDVFTPTEYNTFEDWFLRQLTPETYQQCIENAKKSPICAPVQGEIRNYPFGGGRLKNSIISAPQLDDLLANSRYKIQISLKKCDYHWVHAPCDGIITDIKTLEHGTLFPKSESMTVFYIKSKYGDVALACIGEQTVQTFAKDAKVGDKISKMKPIGYFYFGSQILMGIQLPMSVFEGDFVFPGDPLCNQYPQRTT